MANWTAALRMTLNATAVTRGLQGVRDGVSGAISSMQKLASAGSAAGQRIGGALRGAGDVLFKLPSQVQAVQGILGGLTMPMQLAAQAEATQVAFTVLSGSAEDATRILAELRSIADKSPFGFDEVAAAGRTLAAFKIPLSEVGNMTARLADLAAGLQTPLGEIALLYGKARVSGTLFAEDLNQFMERGVDILGLFGQITGKSAGEVKKLASEGKITFPMLQQAINLLTNEGGQFYGMMETMSKTTVGRWSSLKDAIDGVMITLGTPINDALRPLLADLAKLAEDLKPQMLAIGWALRDALNFAMQIIKDGKVGELLTKMLVAGALTFGEYLYRVVDYAGKRFGLLIDQAVAKMTFNDGAFQKALNEERSLKSQGIGGEFIGDYSLNKEAEAARKAAMDLASQIDTRAREAQERRNEEAKFAQEEREATNKLAKAKAEAAAEIAAKKGGFWENMKKVVDAVGPKLQQGAAAVATSMAQGAKQSAKGSKTGKGLFGQEVDDGKGRYSDLGNLQKRFMQSDAKSRGSFSDFARKNMGATAFDSMTDAERKALTAADPTQGGKVKPTGRADQLAAIQQGQERAKAAISGQQADAELFQKAATMLLKALPGMEKSLTQLATE